VNKTKIDWCDYTWNPIVGCRNGCWYCYAKGLFERFNPGEKFEDIHTYPERLKDPGLEIKKPKKIFVGSMTDLMDTRIPVAKIKIIFKVIEKHPWHTFMFLTKNNYAYDKITGAPKNCWLGITIDGQEPLHERMTRMAHLIKGPGKIKFVSFEPLLGEVAHLIKPGIDWIIIGGLSGKNKEFKNYKPNPKHITDILAAARYYKIPVFLKSNLGWRPELLNKNQNYPDIYA